ncbi:Clp protease ClpP [Ochrobactrum sp. MR28]|nr:Clp protease ClpP [Ochrobactrum sp. MR28]MBX8818773.1 Clp protease ClpP [Ochrobactrum sp. MR31]
MAAILEDGKLRLSGYVGDYYFEDGFTSADVVMALAQIDETAPLTVHINSAGGIATEGSAIHALLSGRAGQTDVVVEGIAASAASLIAMAGNKVTMSTGSIMMIHDPATSAWGTSKELGKAIEYLEASATSYARVYANKSGKTAEDCRVIMQEERWFTPEQAVEEGFADATTQSPAQPVAAFDYTKYIHAPAELTALARKNNWSMSASQAAPAAQARHSQENNMKTDKERADELAAELAALKTQLTQTTASVDEAVMADRNRRTAIMALPEAKGREALAEHLFTLGNSLEQAKATLAVSPAAAADSDVTDFETRRLNGEGLNGGGTQVSGAGRAVLSAAVERTNKRR